MNGTVARLSAAGLSLLLLWVTWSAGGGNPLTRVLQAEAWLG